MLGPHAPGGDIGDTGPDPVRQIAGAAFRHFDKCDLAFLNLLGKRLPAWRLDGGRLLIFRACAALRSMRIFTSHIKELQRASSFVGDACFLLGLVHGLGVDRVVADVFGHGILWNAGDAIGDPYPRKKLLCEKLIDERN
jgi:hypothetical protein